MDTYLYKPFKSSLLSLFLSLFLSYSVSKSSTCLPSSIIDSLICKFPYIYSKKSSFQQQMLNWIGQLLLRSLQSRSLSRSKRRNLSSCSTMLAHLFSPRLSHLSLLQMTLYLRNIYFLLCSTATAFLAMMLSRPFETGDLQAFLFPFFATYVKMAIDNEQLEFYLVEIGSTLMKTWLLTPPTDIFTSPVTGVTLTIFSLFPETLDFSPFFRTNERFNTRYISGSTSAIDSGSATKVALDFPLRERCYTLESRPTSISGLEWFFKTFTSRLSRFLNQEMVLVILDWRRSTIWSLSWCSRTFFKKLASTTLPAMTHTQS